jgi:hypothetical protein
MADHLKPHQFLPGQPKTPGSGRQKGVRNKLSERFLKDLHDEWERSGAQTLKILAVENPAALAAIVAKVIPQAFDAEAPAVLHIVTGVVRHGEIEDHPNRTPQIPAAVPSLPIADDSNTDDCK